MQPAQYREKPKLLAGYYGYWSGLPMNGRFEAYVRPEPRFAAWPTNDELTVVIGGWPYADSPGTGPTSSTTTWAMFELAPGVRGTVRRRPRETRLVGAAVPNFFRKPYGPGWALVGDSGYHKDFITPGHPGRVPGRGAVRDGDRLTPWVTGARVRRRDGGLPDGARRRRSTACTS